MVEGIDLDKQNEELLQKYFDTKDIEAYQSLLILNDKLNYHVARKFLNSGEDVDDLASIARIGMIKAIKSFDPYKNIKFATYATRCMTNEILMSFRKDKKHKNNVSLEQPLYYDGEGNELKLEDLVESGAPDAIDLYIEREEISRLRQSVEQLEGRDRVIIEQMYFKGKTQKEVSQLLGISQSYVSRIEKKLLKKLRGIYDKTKGEITMSNKLKPEKLQVLRESFEEGLNPKQSSNRAGVSYSTAHKYYNKFLEEQPKEEKEAPAVHESEVLEEVEAVEVIEKPKALEAFEYNSKCSTTSISLTKVNKSEIRSFLNSFMLTVNEEESYNLDILITKEVS